MKANVKTLAVAAVGVASIVAHAQSFKLTITNTGPQPLSPLFVATSTNQFNIFSIDAPASIGIKNTAERGDASAMMAIATASPAVGWSSVLGASPLVPGASRTFVIQADPGHPFFSFAAMLGQTNDGFIGESVNSLGLTLFNGSAPRRLDLEIKGDRAWDAGTKKNTQNAADLAFLGGTGDPPEDPWDAHVRVHSGVIAGIGDSWALMPNWNKWTVMARISVVPLSNY